ncbi:DNA damage response protein RcaA [Talaromyces proteolyticus]|uniref:DNA damage response protein RcaA n=1 Tax=Talaromyces proteolyticus TaxID=1131652 RepID=A0AAD4KK60_9EURO|nr:DNA damage response protein RcaA [Talaromyces proteolyticus]KAH8690109.1 DNA damage response protein RcaA [Talaromyces proteolyticus]
MWILESDGDLLGGKRVWLKPGKKYLFGRIKQEGVRHVIHHVSISRKHLVIEVSPVQAGDGAHVHKKSVLTVTDQGSKCGTTVDTVQIRGSSQILTQDEHTLQLGRYPPALRIKWHPTVLSFSFSSKELKAKDPLGPARSRLEDLDIKTIIPYVEKTTHVVQNKRNTAKGLQALINGKYIVQDSYLDALVYAATPGDLEISESLSPLEVDYDAHWPDANLFLPPAGKEPVQRPAESFAPNASRSHVFEGYTFVFCDTSQFENLSPPINNGHGKALFYQVHNGHTTADDLLQYMRNAAGEKGLGSEHNGDGGIVLVRFRAKGHEDWSIELGNQVAIKMDQRVIEQSEFLDAILSNDATSLCRSLPREEAPASREPQTRRTRRKTPEKDLSADAELPEVTTTQPEDTAHFENTQAEKQVETQRAKRSQSRPFVSRLKGFDDGFDMEDIPIHHSESGDVNDEMEVQVPSSQPEPVDVEEDDGMSGLLPGANAMKRRRADMGSRLFGDDLKAEEAPKPKRQKVDVLAAARRHREEEEAAAREQKQENGITFQAVAEGMAIEEMKNLVLVEEFEVPNRPRQSATVKVTDRWDEGWNGRKNFKKFRKKGEPGAPRSRIQAVIVPLDEVKRKDYGIGDHYWTNNNNQRDDSPEPIFKRTSQQPSSGRPASRAESQASLDMSEEPPTSFTAPSAHSETPRPAASVTQKSQRVSQKRTRGDGDNDSDGEELRFKFRRRR